MIVPVGMISCIAAWCVCLQWAARTPEMDPWALIAILVTPAFFIPIHELLHCVGYRVPLRSRHLVTGIWRERGVWYVVYDAPLPRKRVLWMLIAPLLGFAVWPRRGAGAVTRSTPLAGLVSPIRGAVLGAVV